MATPMWGKVVNLDRLQAKLRKLSAVARKEVLANAVMAGAKVIEEWEKINIRDQNLVDTGHLWSESTYHRLESASATRAEASAGTNAEYGIVHEYGWNGNRVRPFLRPAVDEHGPEIEDAVEAPIKEAVTKVLV